MNQEENSGYSFEGNEQFSWEGSQLREIRYQKILNGFAHLSELFEDHTGDEEPEDVILLDAMGDVIESLHRTFVHHFRPKTGHVVSPKSDEPWD